MALTGFCNNLPIAASRLAGKAHLYWNADRDIFVELWLPHVSCEESYMIRRHVIAPNGAATAPAAHVVSLQRFRRDVTQLAIQRVIAATAVLPVGLQQSSVRSLTALVGRVPMLRWKVQENMRLALGHDVSDHAASLYFRHLGWFLSNSVTTLHHGIAATPVPGQVKFDTSVRVLDEAVAEGRGVVFASPHWSGHELMAAMISRRHPMAMLVRQAPTSEQASRKLKWYNALGVETVLRPRGSTRIKEAKAYLAVLKQGKLLALTPDLLAEPGAGVQTRIFGRPARLHGGAFALAISARAPLIRGSIVWQADSSAMIIFDRAPLALDARDRHAAVRIGVQDWCYWFESKLIANPENWLFWLDKRWSRFLRATSHAVGAG